MDEGAEYPNQRILLVRHAQTEWSLSGQHTGRTDLPLTEQGRELTEHLRRRLDGAVFDRVLTSPLRRARDTCEIAGFADRAEVCDDLVEWDYGDYEGRTTADIRTECPTWDLWRDGAPGGESPQDVAHRLDRVVDTLLESCAAREDVLVFGHGHSLKALAIRWLGFEVIQGRHLDLGTGSVSALGWKREVPVLDRWNDRSHLPPDVDRWMPGP